MPSVSDMAGKKTMQRGRLNCNFWLLQNGTK